MPRRPATQISIRNLGTVSRGWLDAIGIRNLADVQKLGAVGTAQAVRAAGYPATFNLVLALQGALMDRDWRTLPDALRRDLRHVWDHSRARSNRSV